MLVCSPFTAVFQSIFSIDNDDKMCSVSDRGRLFRQTEKGVLLFDWNTISSWNWTKGKILHASHRGDKEYTQVLY